jgi:hypothetical protein
MHLKSTVDIGHFLIAIQKCQNDVFFETSEGDRLNLSSTLSQFIFCTAAGQSYDFLQGTVRCVNPDDRQIIAPYLEK